MKEGLFIGLMSGTSMDGIDVAISEIVENSITIVAEIKVPYPEEISRQLEEIVLNNNLSGLHELATLDIKIGRLFGKAAQLAMDRKGLLSSQIIAVGSHGQTIKHSPELPNPYSLQIGDGSTIAAITGLTTITNFRSLDVAHGGQGAPLVPAFHEWCFASSSGERIILNIGGISNITILNPNYCHPIGYDTGPGNCLMDEWTRVHLQKPYDEGGSWAARGEVIPKLLHNLLAHEYFSRPTPKSTGRELFNLAFLNSKVSALNLNNKPPEDIQATLLQFSVESIKDAIGISAYESTSPIFICGGGFFNDHLVSSLRHSFSEREIGSTELLGYSPGFLEASAFSWLAYMRVNHIPVKLVTGDNLKYLELGTIHS